jgi:RimJ/RimL family protein N-acetyltransferase
LSVASGSPRVEEGGVVLRPFARADVPQLVAWTPNAHFLMQWAGPTLTYPITCEQFDNVLGQDPARPQTMAWQIVDSACGEALGHIELAAIDGDAGTAHVNRVLVGSPDARGRGVGGAAIRAVLRVAWERLRLVEVTLAVFAWNRAAIRCYEREGFLRVDLQRPEVGVDGETREVMRMAARRDRRAPAGSELKTGPG